MPRQATRPAPAQEAAPRARRLTAEARKSSILQAARRAFTETGDMNGTTIRHIAERAGISEGVIYRHFESKDQLFFEAVVEPLSEAVDKLVVGAQAHERRGPGSPEDQLEAMATMYRQLTSTLQEILPLLGLVLFGDPKVAKRFYAEKFAPAMDRLAEAWGEIEQRYGFAAVSPDVSARAVMGIALVLALEARNKGRNYDRDRAIALASEGTFRGFFPAVDPGRRPA